MFAKIHIRKHQRGLWLRDGDFHEILGPGTHWLWGRLLAPQRHTVEVIDAREAVFEHAMLEVLLKEDAVRAHLEVVNLEDAERALVWKDGRLFKILGPGLHAFWKGVADLHVERFDTGTVRFTHPKMPVIIEHPGGARWFYAARVTAGEAGLLFRDGVLIERLPQGLHVFWRGTGDVRWSTVDLKEQVADVAGQEIISSDKVTLRVNLVVTYVVIDAEKAVTAVADHKQALYRDAQLALRAAIGARALDALLADKEAVGAEVREALAKRSAELGLAVKNVGLRDIILPGDMKALFNQVIAATKEAEANLIRRREETAAARSQANTARLLAESPQLARLKELELLKEVLAGAKTTFVFGQGEIADQVRGLIAKGKDDG